MKKNTMIAGSFPEIITSGGNPRTNKDQIENPFLRKYMTLFGEMLKVKGEIKDLNITYVGGYTNSENISRSKGFISAFNYFLNDLGYDSLSKNNLTVLDANQINIDALEQSDLLFLGIGSDQTFTKQIEALENKGIQLNQLVEEKNMLVTSICSGTVMAAERIYGGMYDTYYHDREPYDYPTNLDSLRLNPVTMETNFFPNSASTEKAESFTKECLLPDSFKTTFFACRPNSFFLIGKDKIYSYGEMYLFMDGECLKVEGDLERADATSLVYMVQKYNDIKGKENIIKEDLAQMIKNTMNTLQRKPIQNQLEKEEEAFLVEYQKEEKRIQVQKDGAVNGWKMDLKGKLDYLFSEENITKIEEDFLVQKRIKNIDDSIWECYNVPYTENFVKELYLKMNAVSIIKKSYIDYPGYYADFKKDFYSLLEEYATTNSFLTYMIVESCGSLFGNAPLKKLLKKISTSVESVKKPQSIIDSTQNQKKLFREGRKYARS